MGLLGMVRKVGTLVRTMYEIRHKTDDVVAKEKLSPKKYGVTSLWYKWKEQGR